MKEVLLLMIIAQASSLFLDYFTQSRPKHPTSLKFKPIETSHHHSWTETFFNNKPLRPVIMID
jgi:hypothetical protein